MSLSSRYDPSRTEQKWYDYWMKHSFFRSFPDGRKPYTIVIPPPNVTGVLHMGHMLNNTIQDVLIRKKRMEGFNTLWIPGTDHASIATEARVVAKLAAEGYSKKKIGRDRFLEHAWEWTRKHGGIILEQLRKLGASCDWERTRFTMDDKYYKSVIKVFTDLYDKGYIYRGVRMVNWDPLAKTAISDEEVNYREVKSRLYYVRYRIVDSEEWITIATTRPETIMGDTAVAVNPDDKRYRKYHGRKIIIPIIDRMVPLITDSYVDREFGTGALKITPAHDINDYEIGIRHGLESVDVLNDDGTLNEKAGFAVGKDRQIARDEVVAELQKRGQLVKVEDYLSNIGFSERTDAMIEPRLSMQWFLKMKELSEPALKSVVDDTIKLYPAKFKNIYRHWMENVKDWCLSRQLWWGHQIPAWYIGSTNDFVVAETVEEAVKKAREKTGDPSVDEKSLRQDEDVLDTWFSSWLWPIAVLDGILDPENKDFKYFYPTSDLVTAPEILFFWVARMIIAGYEYPGEKPFDNVYLTGIVRDNLRRKMSKSLGNSPEPMDLIKKYSADGVRVGMLLCSPAGGDLLYDDSLPEQGRNFSNKIWNAFRLTRQWEVDKTIARPAYADEAVRWFENRLSQGIRETEKNFKAYRISEALMTVYRLFWDEFSAWYLELVKPGYGKPMDFVTAEKTKGFFDTLLKLLHPFMPFITEEIWQQLEKRTDGESIMNTRLPSLKNPDRKVLKDFEDLKEVVAALRTARKEQNILEKQALALFVKDPHNEYSPRFHQSLVKLGNLSVLTVTDEKPANAISFRLRSTDFFIPLESGVDHEQELKKLKDELSYTRGFLVTVLNKLQNEKFVNHAPEKVVELERKKQADAELRIKVLEERISHLGQE